MDFARSQEQEGLERSARTFGATLNEGVVERDKAGAFWREGWEACARFGLQGMVVPRSHGGTEMDPCDMVAILEGVGYGCRDNGLLFSVNAHMWACEIPICHFGNEEQKTTYLPRLSSGEWIGANAMTEPDAGSDVFSLTTTARKQKDGYLLNGSKTFVSNAPMADVFIVYARTGESKGFAGLSCFVIEKETAGLTVGRGLEKMGLRTSPMAELAFHDCLVPAKNLLGKEGSGSMIFSDSMEYERLFILSSCLGRMTSHLESCVKYATMRKMRGKPISKLQAVANKLVDMKLRLATSRLMLHEAAWIKGQRRSAAMESAMAKLCVSEAYVHNCREAMQLFGGYGYMVEYEWEREMRDALASTLYSGTSEVQRNIVAGMMGL